MWWTRVSSTGASTTTPARGGASDEISSGVFGDLYATGARLYLHEGADLYAAPRTGGPWQFVAQLPDGVRAIEEQSGKLHVLTDSMLMRVEPLSRRDRRLVDAIPGPIVDLAGAGNQLYYTVQMWWKKECEIWSVPKAGGTPSRIARDITLGSAPVFDDASFYALDGDGALVRAPLRGGGLTTLAAPARAFRLKTYEPPLPRAIAIDAAAIYWLDASRGAVMIMPKHGGAPAVLADGLPGPQQLAVAAGHVFVELYDDAGHWQLVHVAATGGVAPEPLAAHQRPIPFAVDGKQVIWAIDKRLYTAPVAGGPSREIPAFPLQTCCSFQELVLDGDTLFFTRLNKLVTNQSLSRDGVRVVASGHFEPAALVIDPTAVYFVERGRLEHVKGEEHRHHCCSIWAAPR